MTQPLPSALMPPAPEPPARRLPEGSVDCHVHLVAGHDDFPLWDGRVEDPAPGPDFDGWLDLYRAHLAALGCSGGLIVHSILYGGDNAVTLAAVRRMGPGFRGVGLLPDGADTAALDAFAEAGMVAVRLNYVHGGLLSWEGARAMAPALAERGMHLQMLAHSDRHMQEIAADVRALPCPVVFDHLGWPADEMSPDTPGFQALCALLAEGHAYVKLSAPYRMAHAPYAETDACAAALIAANPDACLWGSDWPHLMLGGAAQPRLPDLVAAIERVIPDDATRQKIFVDTPRRLFGLDPA